ncbi:MAG: XRE family transcriptional regulator [Deltaproteobacteria bacterium HGW-Deltaproteobacteria-22]|nr:MAG: XRE family transcriptional regulator [Deltaproteobacteria bacterium HGW-Deltaproteobacteria-22]
MELEERFDRWMNDAEKTEDFQVEKLILHFTEEVVSAMKVRNMSQADLARLLVKSPAYVSKMLAGETNFTLRSLVRIARALDLRLQLGLVERRVHAPKDHSSHRQKRIL